MDNNSDVHKSEAVQYASVSFLLKEKLRPSDGSLLAVPWQLWTALQGQCQKYVLQLDCGVPVLALLLVDQLAAEEDIVITH